MLGCAGLGMATVLAKIAYAHGVGVVTLLAFRYLAASVLLVPLAFAHRRRGAEPVRLRRWLLLSLVYLGSAFTFWAAISYGKVTEVAPIGYLYPALVALVGVAFAGERLGRLGVLAFACAAVGSSLIFGVPSSGGSLAAKLLAVATAVFTAVYYVLAGRFARAGQELQGTAIMCLSCGLVMLALVPVAGLELPDAGRGWGALVGIALGGTVLALILVLNGVGRIGATNASVLTLVEPVVSVVLAVVILGEGLGGAQLAGVVFILTAFVLSSLRRATVREDVPPVPS